MHLPDNIPVIMARDEQHANDMTMSKNTIVFRDVTQLNLEENYHYLEGQPPLLLICMKLAL